MVTHVEAFLNKISIHKIGNKSQLEPCNYSDSEVIINDEVLKQLLMQFFLNPFEKSNELYQFYHSSDNLRLNEMFHFSEAIFDETEDFHELSISIAKHLYDVSDHPKIKSGEVYIANFKQLQIEGELYDAIGIFKSETKETYLKVYPEKSNFQVSYEEEAINIKKLEYLF